MRNKQTWTDIETAYLRRFIREEVFPYRRPFPEGERFENPSDYKPNESRQFLMTVALSVCEGEIEYGKFKIILADRPGLLWNVFRKPRKDSSLDLLVLPRWGNNMPSIVQRLAWSCYRQMRRNCNPHLGIFGTTGPMENYTYRVFVQHRLRRCEDLESIIWQRIWQGKGINDKAIIWGLREYVRNKIRAKKKAGLIRVQEHHDHVGYTKRQDGHFMKKKQESYAYRDTDDPEYQQDLAESLWKEI